MTSLTRHKDLRAPLLIILVALLLFHVAYLAVPVSAEPAILDITVSNVRDTTFTVSWVTSVPTTGTLHYGTTAALGVIANDTRGATTTATTHYVTLSSLNPGTQYFFDVRSGDTVDSNGGSHYTVNTGPTLALPSSDTIYGRVLKVDGTTPANGAIVYITVVDNNGLETPGNSALMSALVNSNGYWFYNLGNTRTPDTAAYFAYSSTGGDNLQLVAKGASAGNSEQLVVSTSGGNPAPDLILKGTTSTTISSSRNPSTFGESVTFTATVTSTAGTPTGSVTFKNGSTTLGSSTLNASGIATHTISSLFVGSHSITAQYADNASFFGSTSAAVIQVVNKATLVFTNLGAPTITYGTAATILSGNLRAGTLIPTGAISITVNGVTQTAPINSGDGGFSSSFPTGSLPVTGSPYTITYNYGGVANFGAASDQTKTLTVQKANTVTAIASDTPDPSVVGQSVVVNFSVTSATATPIGTVAVSDGTVSCSNTVAAGSCMLVPTTTGTKTLTATYLGDNNFNGSSSSGVSHTVIQASTATALTSWPNASVFGQSVTFTATVGVVAPGAGALTGTITFKDGATALYTGTLVSGIATYSTTALAAGSHNMTAVYNGDANFAASASSALAQIVNQANTTTVVSSTPSPSAFGQSVTFTATIGVVAPGAGTRTGTVQFSDNGTPFGDPRPVAGNVATLITTTLGAGSHTITAAYSGDASFNSSTSAGWTQVVNKADTTTTIASSSNSSVFGQSVTFTATVTSSQGMPSGTVTIKDGSITIFTAILTSGVATFTTNALGAGAHSFTATYNGDSNYTASVSSGLAQTVNKANQTITFNALPNKTYGDADVNLTTFASSTSGLPLSFTVGTGNPCAIVDSNKAYLLGAGSCTITATQTGDANYNAAAPVSRSFTIAPAAESITLSNLNHTFDGTPKAASAATAPVVGVTVVITYTGISSTGYPASTTPPTNAGSYSVLAHLDDPNYTASDATGTLTILKADQVLNITTHAPAIQVYSTTFTVAAVGGGSGQPVSYSSEGACTNNGATFTMTSGTGTCTVKYDQAGNANYNAAPQRTEGVTAQKAIQTITFNTLSNKTYGDADVDLTLFASSTSGLPLGFTAGAGNPCAIVDGNKAHLSGAGTCTVTASQAGNANYLQATDVIRSLTISQRPITVSANFQSKTYGVSDPALTYQITSGSLVLGDSFAGALTRVPGEAVGTYTIQQGTLALNSNYVLTYIGANLSITKRPITVTADAQSKNYGEADPTLTYQVTGGSLVPGDSFTGALARVSGENVGAYAIQQGTLTAGSNYDLTYFGANLSISNRAITVTADAKNKVYGDADPTLTFQISSGSLITGDTFTGALTRTAGESVGSYAIQQGTLTLNSNYDLGYVGASLAITARSLTVSATGMNKIYDGTTMASASVTLSDNRVSGDALTISYSTATFADKNVGTNKPVNVSGIAVTGGAAGNYILASTTAATTANITARALTVVAASVNKTYDGTTSATVTLSDDRLPGDVFTASYTSASFGDKNVGIDKPVSVSGIAISGTDAGNYSANTSASTTATIAPRALSVTATGVNKVYDRTTTATVTLSDNRVPGDLLTDSYTDATFADKNVGSAKIVNVSGISISGPDAGNYSTNATATTYADITARVITGSITTNGKQYDATTAATIATRTLDGVLNGDTVSYVGGAATYADKNVGTDKTVTATGLSLSGADAGNYVVNSAATTTATIAARPLTVVATGINKTYDGTPLATVTLSDDKLSGDSVTDTYISASFADKNNGTDKTVTITGISVTGTDASNYSLVNTTASTVANIAPRVLTISAAGVNKVYDGTTNAIVTLSDNRVAGDQFSSNYTSGSFNDKTVGTAKSVSVSGLSITGADAGNYNFNTTAATTANITPRNLTITATGQNKVYDGTTSVAVTLSDNRVPGDAVTAIDTSASFADKLVGTSKLITVTGIFITGADAGNYTVSPTATATADITRRTLTISATGMDKVYNGSTSATITLSDNRVLGDVFTDSYTSATFAGKNVGPNKPVSVSGIAISGPDAGNYSFNATESTTASITKRNLAVTATGIDKVYDGTTAATVTLSNNRIQGDSLTDTYATANFADKNVGTGKVINVSGISISGTDAGNYNLLNTTATTTANITARALTVTANDQTKVYGTPDPFFTFQYGGFVNGETSTVIDTPPTCAVASAHINAGDYPITCSGGADNNYAMSYVSGTLTITRADQTIIFNTLPTKTYGDADVDLTLFASSTSGLPLSFTAGAGNPCAIVDGNNSHLSGTGSCTITAAQSGDANYNAALPISRTFTILVASATINLIIPSPNPIYDGTPKSASATTNPVGLALVITYTGTGGTVYPASAIPPTNAGTYSVVAHLVDPNYTASDATGTFTIAKAGTTTMLFSSGSPSLVGQPVTFTAIVTATTVTPSGTVTFTVDTQSIMRPLANGTATYVTDTLSAGTHVVTAQYNGDVNFNPSSQTGAQDVHYPAPSVTASSPSSVYAGSPALTVTITGTNFVNGSIVRWNGSNRATGFVSSTQLTAAIPANDLATVGTYTVTVFNPTPGGGEASPALIFTVAQATTALTLTSSGSPSLLGQPVTFTATLSQTGRRPTTPRDVTPTSVVTFTVDSSTNVTRPIAPNGLATLVTNALTAGAHSIVAQYSGDANLVGSTSNTLTHTVNNPLPTVTSISPSSGQAGQAIFTLTITGTNFVNGATVLWNGGVRTTTYISSTKLTASIPASDVSAIGVAYITVRNPASGGGVSDVMPFHITSNGTGLTATDAATGNNPIASTGSDGITATASGSGTLSVAQYASNPGTPAFFGTTGVYNDVHISTQSVFTQLSIVMCNLKGGTVVYWWNGLVWTPASSQSYDPSSKCVTVLVDRTTTPNLNDLTGTVFGVGVPIQWLYLPMISK